MLQAMQTQPKTLSGSRVGDISNPAFPVFADAVEVTHPHEVSGHKHHRGQLVYATHGTLQVGVEQSCVLVPPQLAVWIPPRVEHTVRAAEPVHYCSLFVDPTATQLLPPCWLAVTMQPLLKELALTAATFERNYKAGSPESRLIAVLLDQLRSLRPTQSFMALPKDARLRRIAEAVIQKPGDDMTLYRLADRARMSQRSFERRFKQDTGLTFGQWRQRLQVQIAIQRLEAGHTVQSLAIELGYQTTSAFIVMFRRVTGASPKRYLAQINRT